jgi:hypothetical protein
MCIGWNEIYLVPTLFYVVSRTVVSFGIRNDVLFSFAPNKNKLLTKSCLVDPIMKIKITHVTYPFKPQRNEKYRETSRSKNN